MRRGLRILWRCGLAAAAMTGAAPIPASTQEVYAGKTIDFLIGSDVGGGFDIYARTIARHLGRFIAGNPTIVPKNQPGAGSGRVAAFLYSLAPKDGSAIGALFPGAIVGPLLDERAHVPYDPVKVQYLASADSATRICITHARSPVRTLDDARRQRVTMGASGSGASTRDYVNFIKRATGVLFELVSGYKGSADIFLAMERGEVDGMCGIDWSSLKSERPQWLSDNSVNILVQANIEPDPELGRRGVPQLWPYLLDDKDRPALELILAQQAFSRPYVAPPAVPAEPLRILRDAFAATLADRDFLADAARSRIDIVPTRGEVVQWLVERLYSASPPAVQRARQLLLP